MSYAGNSNDFKKMKDEVNALKTHLRRHQISMGEEKVCVHVLLLLFYPPTLAPLSLSLLFTLDKQIEYVTDYRQNYQTKPEDVHHGDRKAELKKVIEETRRCHFSLGDDRTEYKSNAHR